MAREFESVAEIQEILARGAFDELTGALENEIFEAKADPWDLDSERGKFDLAKDISSLANVRGGIIVVGATPFESPTKQRREVKGIRRLPASFTPSDRYWDIVAHWIYKPPIGVNFRWHPDPSDPSIGLISVYVPDYGGELRPFLVAHYLPEKGNRISSVIGLFERLGSTTKPTPIEDLHAFIKEGRRLDEIHQKLNNLLDTRERQRLDEIHQKLDTLIEKFAGQTVLESKPWIKRIFTKIRSRAD